MNEKIAELSREVSKLRTDLHTKLHTSQNNHATVSYHVRTNTLDDWATMKSDRVARNTILHGGGAGDVISDIGLLSHIEQATERRKAWKKAFRRMYAVSLKTYIKYGLVRNADSRLVEVLNLHANTLALESWTGERNGAWRNVHRRL
ncbi:hypothetical protein BJX64DRAFT_294659 [Aspergillus heterothallicus]